MKIKKIQLTNFKRFSSLTIDFNKLPKLPKLVLLLGSNGSGKSSIFDAFELVSGFAKDKIMSNDKALTAHFGYYRKNSAKDNFQVIIETDKEGFDFNSNDIQSNRDPSVFYTFYGRSSLRQVPRLTRANGRSFTKEDVNTVDTDRPRFYIDRDERFENDIEIITRNILDEAFKQPDITISDITNKYIVKINNAFGRIFNSKSETTLRLKTLIPPLADKVAEIQFQKGKSDIHYDLLSNGEKEVFNVLFNLISRQDLYQDTIFFIDELDLHLNTQLQFNLLKEITENWIPENCQLWTASHSLGFIEYAKQSDHAAILDFDDYDFDKPRVLTPEPKENPDIYEIAVGKDFLPSLFQNMTIYFVENKDNVYYASIGIPKSIFVPDNNRNNVYHKVRTTQMKGIVDRDFLSDDDVKNIRKHYPNLYVLNYYSIENYMYHPDNLEAYYLSKNKPFDKKEYIKDLIDAKNQVKNSIITSIALDRSTYPFFGEPLFNGTPLQRRFRNEKENRDESNAIQEDFNSDTFETFYKVLPMKTYCTHLPQRQNIAKSDLVKTKWFKNQIEKILK